MRIYEIELGLKLQKPLYYRDSIEFLSRNVNRIIYHSMLLRTLHDSKNFKPYVVGSMGRTEKDRRYHPGKPYTLRIRSIDEGFVGEFLKAAVGAEGLEMELLEARAKPYRVGRVEKVYTITPAVLTFERNRYWTPEDDLQIMVRAVRENLRKKYRYFFKKEIEAPEDFIYYFKLENKTPILFNYKGGKIFANRFTFGFGDDEASQKLARLAFGVGLLEKNPLGFGMVVRGKR